MSQVTRSEALLDIAEAQAQAGAIVEAQSTLRGITFDEVMRVKAHNAIAKAQSKAGDHAGAARTIAEAQSVLRTSTLVLPIGSMRSVPSPRRRRRRATTPERPGPSPRR